MEHHMNIILLSGGSGKRLWPLSNDVRSKQFLKIFQREDGVKESMVQRMYRIFPAGSRSQSVRETFSFTKGYISLTGILPPRRLISFITA